MPKIDKHAPGSFNWIELGASDQNSAKTFYKALFGWTSYDVPMGPDGIYTGFQIDGLTAAAAHALKPEEIANHAPSRWMLYIAVESADQTARKAAAHGAKVVIPPFDVFTFGRMAVLLDPTGAIFSVWQAKEHKGTEIGGVNGTLCWADLNTFDRDLAKSFYASVFGWTIEKGEHDHSDYLHIRNGDTYIGGIPAATQRDPNMPPHWLPYIQVADCDPIAAKAKDLGGAVCHPPTLIEKTGTFAVLADPQGAAFAVFTPAPHA